MSEPNALPVSWAISTLGEMTTSIGGGTPSKFDPSFWTNGTIPWVSPKDMKVLNVTSSEDLLTPKALGHLSLIPTESVLVVVRSGILSRTFPVSLNKMPVTINQDMRAFVPKSGVSARYLALQLIAKEQEILSNCSKHGTTVASIEGPALARFPLALSPPAEQTRIVEKLEELLSDLDAGVAELKAAQKKLGQYRQSLLKAAVEGALTAQWRAQRRAPSPPTPLPQGERGVEASPTAHLTPGERGVEASSPAHLTPAACGAETATQALLQQGRATFAFSAPRAQTPEDPFLAPLSPRGRGVGGEGASQPATEDEAWLQARARELRQQQTPEEHALWQQLRAKRFAGYKFRRQQPLGRFIVDFVCFAQRLIVELDGGQHAEAAEYDSRRDAWLKQQGFRMLRFWNNEWSAQREAVLEAIWQALQQEPPLPNPSPTRGEGLEAADIARPAVVPSAPFWREEKTTLSALPGEKTHALAFPRDAEEAALSPLSPGGRGVGGEGASARETGAQLLQRILATRRARWEAKQLAKFAEQGKTPPKDWQKKYPEPVQPDTSDLPELPEGWVWATIDQLAQVGTGVTPLRSKSAYFDDGTIPWVTSGALNSETVTSAMELVTDLALKECRLEVYPPGSLLVAMYGEGKTRGKCSELLIAATINQAIAAIVLEPDATACRAYVKAFLLDSYERMRAQASGGVQPNLNLQIVKSIALPLPPVDEQGEIANVLDRAFGEVSQQQAAVELALKQSAAQRKNILKAAFSGQLVPQDPNDEPASVLLARIRAERAVRDAVKKSRGRKAKETS